MDVSRHNGEVAEISEKLEKSLSMDTEDKMEAYQRYIQEGKDTARQGDLNNALKCFKKAYKIHQSQKLESRIKKIEELLALNDSEEEEEEFVDVNGSGLMLFRELHDNLYDYQRDGVAFMYSLYRDGRKGGILADDMGLGKTIQVISFLSGMYDNELIKHTLLVMPTSLITNWTKEFAKWTPGMRVKEFHGVGKERTRNLEKVQRRSGVIITTYNMLINNWQQLSSHCGKEFTWDYMILDEAHKIKNPSAKTAKSAYAIPSKNRVLLTGTPVQNNLKEMWALFDFACQGALLGTAKTFKSEFENPITRAREKDATPGEKALGCRMSENLMAIIKPHFLRRTKAEVQKKKMNSTHPGKQEDSDNQDGQVPKCPKESGAVMPKLTRKNDLIVWTYLSSIQEDIYRQFLSLDHIKELLMTTRSPLAELNILKKLCDHPRLLSAAAIAKLGLEESAADGEQNAEETDSGSIANVPDDSLISESGKLVFLFALLERLREEGHRTLVFAHYRKVLDIIERILGNRGFKVMRLDGTITHIAERERRISLFQTDRSYSVFLLTTQVGGVGITLTAANRVVIYDPSWNPATDAQAVDRAYRIGQTENVVIYRLITCGTVEEKIYRRQVFKDSLIRQNTGDKKNPFRYFSRQDLKELFTLEDTQSSSTQIQLQDLHSRHRRSDPELDEHIAQLHAMEMFGISDHDLMFSLDVNHDEAPEDEEAHHYIEGRVQKAQELMKAESELQLQLTESMASSTEPAWLRQPGSNNRERSHDRKPRSPRPGPSYPQQELSGSPVVVESEPSGSDRETSQQNLSGRVIDLTADESMSEEKPVGEGSRDKNLESPKHPTTKQERESLVVADASPKEELEESVEMLEHAEAADASVQERMDQSVLSAAAGKDADVSVLSAAAGEDADVSVLSAAAGEDADVSVVSAAAVDDADVSVVSAAAGDDADVSVVSAAAGEDADVSVQVLMDESAVSEAAGDGSLEYVTAAEDDKVLNRLSLSKSDSRMERPPVTPLQNKRLSVLQASNPSFRVSPSPKASPALESFEGNFKLQLEDSDMFSDHDGLEAQETEEEEQETEEEEQKLLSQLLVEGSFDVNKSLSERQHKEALGQSHNGFHATEMDESVNESIVATKRKRAAVIYDSEEEEEEEEDDDDDDEDDHRIRNNSLEALGASTPKSSGPTPRRSRKSLGGNTSVASRQSLLLSLIEDQDTSDEDEVSGRRSEEAEEEALLDPTHDELQLEETVGETLMTESEEEEEVEEEEEEEELEEEEEEYPESGQEVSSNMDESNSEPELASSERMDPCTAAAGVRVNGAKEAQQEAQQEEQQEEQEEEQEESFEALARRGKESLSRGQLDAALSFFLRAIDLQPGDPEIQLMTIQLYRQLSSKNP